MIDVARRSGRPLHVSHLKSLADESLIEPLLELLESAADRARRHAFRRREDRATVENPSPTSPRPDTSSCFAPTAATSPTSTPKARTRTAGQCFALPGRQFGRELDTHFHFHTPGVYQALAQFRLDNGHVITVPFTVKAA